MTRPYSESWSDAESVMVDMAAAASQADAWWIGDRLAVELPQLREIQEWIVERIDGGLSPLSSPTAT